MLEQSKLYRRFLFTSARVIKWLVHEWVETETAVGLQHQTSAPHTQEVLARHTA